MQSVELVVVVAIVIALLLVAVRQYRPSADPRQPIHLILGLGVGLLGAFVALVIVTDVVPDAIEQSLRPFAVGAITLVAIIGSIYRFAR